MRYRLEMRVGPADVGSRVVIRWRRPAPGGGDEVADALGLLEAADGSSFTVRKASGEAVVIPAERALGGKPVPPAPRRITRAGSAASRGAGGPGRLPGRTAQEASAGAEGDPEGTEHPHDARPGQTG